MERISEFIRALVRPFTVAIILPAVAIFSGMRISTALNVANFEEAAMAFKDFLIVAAPIVIYYFKVRDEQNNHSA